MQFKKEVLLNIVLKELRLQKYLADIGYSSRRNIEKLITQNKVVVNNEIAKLGIKVKNKDEVLIENESFIINFDNVKKYKSFDLQQKT